MGFVINNRIFFIALGAFTFTASSSVAQHSPAPAAEIETEGERPFEAFGGYTVLRESGASLSGWTGTLILNVNGWFGLAADFDGHYGARREGAEEARVREHGFTFGPHFAFHNRSRFVPFAFALAGGAHENLHAGGLAESATGFAANLGGGLDCAVNEKLSLRLAQIDAAYTRFHGQGSTSPRFSAGLIFHLGKPK